MLDRDAARAEGIDFTLDIYPYPTGATVPVTFLPGRMQEGGPHEVLKRLEDPALQEDAVAHLENSRVAALDSMVLSYVDGMPELEGMSLPDVARERGVSPGEALCSNTDCRTTHECAAGRQRRDGLDQQDSETRQRQGRLD